MSLFKLKNNSRNIGIGKLGKFKRCLMLQSAAISLLVCLP